MDWEDINEAFPSDLAGDTLLRSSTLNTLHFDETASVKNGLDPKAPVFLVPTLDHPLMDTPYERVEEKEHDSSIIYLCTDGGSRSLTSPASSAMGWLTYDHLWNPIDGGGVLSTGLTNNDAELMAALIGFTHACHGRKNIQIIHLTDSTLVEGALRGHMHLNHAHHRAIAGRISALQGRNGLQLITFQLPRAFNSAADRLCNVAMDTGHSVHLHDLDMSTFSCDTTATRDHYMANIYHDTPTYTAAAKTLLQQTFSGVLLQLSIQHSESRDHTWAPPLLGNSPPLEGQDRYITGFETHDDKHMVDGALRTVSLAAFTRIKAICLSNNIKWNPDAFTLDHPLETAKILSALCVAVQHDVASVIRLVRDQTPSDNRPNKHLRPCLYKKHLSSYPALEHLCAIATDGFKSRVRNFQPPRPLHKNHTSALERAPAVQKRLFKEVTRGRTILMEEDTAIKDPRVNTCPYGVAPKKNVDYEVDGRIVHNASFPSGSSVNDAVPVEKLPAGTDALVAIARRALECYQLYPGVEIRAMCADVDSGFQNAPSHESTALLFGGRIPGTTLVALSLTAIFGFKDSPAIFRILAQAAQHYHGQGRSDILHATTTFWNWLWVDDFVLMEPNIGNRLRLSEQRIREAFHLVFGNPGWNPDKYIPWSTTIHAVGLDWNLDNGTVSMPSEKLEKARNKVKTIIDSIQNNTTPKLKEWRSLIGTLRHVADCVPAAKAFFQKFITTENAILGRRPLDWNGLAHDLHWFHRILSNTHFNGITMERFARESSRREMLYLGWSSEISYIVDFNVRTLTIRNRGSPEQAALLLQDYICHHIIVPDRTGPFPREDLIIDVLCQTAAIARNLNNWSVGTSSLRTLGWLCTQQHTVMHNSGPHLESTNFNLRRHTNEIVQVMAPRATPKPLPTAPSVPGLENYKKHEFEPAAAVHTTTSWLHGSNSAESCPLTSMDFINARLRNKTTLAAFTQGTAASDGKTESPYAPKHSQDHVGRQSPATTRTTSTIRSLRESVWKWQSLDTNAFNRPTNLSVSPLVQFCSVILENSSSLMDRRRPSSYGGVLSLDSSLLPEPARSGVQSIKKRKKITYLSGAASPTETVTSSRNLQTRIPAGSSSILNPPKEIASEKEHTYEWERTPTSYCARSKPSVTFSKEEQPLDSEPATQVESPTRAKDPLDDLDQSTSLNDSHVNTVSMTNASLVTHCGLEGQRSLWQPGLATPSYNSWEGGSQAASVSISG